MCQYAFGFETQDRIQAAFGGTLGRTALTPKGDFLGRPPRSGAGGVSDLPGATKNSAIGIESAVARRSNISRVGFSSPRSIRARYPRAISARTASRFWDTPWATRRRRRFQARIFDARIDTSLLVSVHVIANAYPQLLWRCAGDIAAWRAYASQELSQLHRKAGRIKTEVEK